MKGGILFVLVIFMLSIYSVDAALIWKEDFEDQDYSDTFFTQSSDSTCAAGNGYDALDIVTYQSQNGFYSLRFDSCAVATDSITGLNGCNDIDLYIGDPSTGSIGAVHDLATPVETTDELYVKYWTKYDSVNPLNEELLVVDWFRFPENGFVAFDRNSPALDPLSAHTYESFVLNDYANPLPPVDIHDGNWHKMEYYVNYDYNGLGESSIQGWIDDVLALDWQGPIINGRPDYVRVHRFLGGASACASTPVQIDDVEIWNEIPSLTQCADGAISSLCECGGSSRDYGYCFADEWSTVYLAPCIINDAYWSATQVDMGTQVDLTITGTDCDGKQIDFQILEHDSFINNYEDVTSQLSSVPSSTSFSGNTATTSWNAEWVQDNGGIDNDPEYTFNASLNEGPSEFMLSNNDLKVNFVLADCAYGEITMQCNCGGSTYNSGDGYCCGGVFNTSECPAVTDDSILYLPLDSNYNDYSINNNPVSCIDCPTQTTGQINGAYLFDGASNHFEVLDSPSLAVDQITLAAWINPSSYPNDPRIISKEFGTTDPFSIYSLLISGATDTNLDFRIGVGDVRYQVTGTTDLALSTWTHVAATYDGSNMQLYINGNPEGTPVAVSGTIQDNTNDVYIGASEFYGRVFDGSLDEIRVYDRALNQLEIQAIMVGTPLTSCGDGIVQQPNEEGSGGPLDNGMEECDLTDLDGDNCISLGYDGGSPLGCNLDCTFDETNCYYFSCTDGDGDGYDGYDVTYCPSGNDCNDGNEYENPAGEAGYCDCIGSPDVEICEDTIDQDCSGADLFCPNTPALILNYNFEEGAGNAIDDSGNNNDGTLTGAIYTSTSKIGNYAMEFDGDGDFINVPYDPSLVITDGLTMESWVYPRAVTQFDYIISKGYISGSSPYIDYAMRFDSVTTQIRSAVTIGASQHQVVSSNLPLNDWTHVAMTYSDAEGLVSLYINGELNNTTPASGIVDDSGTDIFIGMYEYNTNEALDGYLDDVRIYNYAITEGEILQHYNLGNIGECTIDDDCNYLDSDYCSGTIIFHDEGNCNIDTCEVQSTLTNDCSLFDNSYCSGTNVLRDVYTCSLAVCELSQTITEQTCDDDIFCNGDETCSAAICQAGTAPITNDGVGCTDDSCDETNDVIVNTPNDGLCDDSDVNTLDTCDLVNDCVFTPISLARNQTIVLSEGWNLISLDINSSATSEDLNAMFVLRYENNDWEKDWGFFPGDEFNLEPLRGYYVYSNLNQSFMFNGTQFVGDYSLVNNTWNLFSVETLDSFDSIYGISLDSDELMDVNVVGDSFVYSYVSGNLNPGQLYWAKIGDARFGPELQSTGIIGWILEGLSYLFNS